MLDLENVREPLGPDFRPFVIRLSDGHALSVPHPDFIAVGRGFVVVLEENDREYRLDPLRIVSIDDSPAEQSNGS